MTSPQDDHAKRVGKFALDAIAAASTVIMDANKATYIDVRCGMHSGSIVASVIGLLNPRWCLFGDAMNLASRMQTTSEPMRIQMTKLTAELIKSQDWENEISYRVQKRAGTVEVKGKGFLQTYWLLTDAQLKHRKNSGTIEEEISIGFLCRENSSGTIEYHAKMIPQSP